MLPGNTKQCYPGQSTSTRIYWIFAMHHCTPAIHRAPLPFWVTCTRHLLQAYTHMSQFTIWWSGNNDFAHTRNPKLYNNNNSTIISQPCHTIKWYNPDDYWWNRLVQNNKINKAPTTCMFPHLLGSHLLHVSIPDHHRFVLNSFFFVVTYTCWHIQHVYDSIMHILWCMYKDSVRPDTDRYSIFK